MEVRCTMCGKKDLIDEDHRDYERIEQNPNYTYFCEMCLKKLQHDANEYNKPKQPIG